MAKWGGEGLSGREAEVLAAVERRLTNAEIAEALHISVRTVESHIAALRRKLDADSRAKLIAAARRVRGATVQLPQNSFVGRDAHLAHAARMLATHRLTTVVGPAGAGKTRLALELAASDTRPPIVAELGGATSADVAPLIARAVGLGADAMRDLVASIGFALAARPYLLVLDNCDRVTGPVREVVAGALTLAPALTVLATSRTPIGASDEAVFVLPPLELDVAARLFADRARSAAPSVDIGEADADTVRRICARLDGLPLAIELAAARVRHLGVAELAERLDDSLDLLGTSDRDDRHGTLGAALGWTWDLLDDEDRRVLCSLAALPGPFDLELANTVAGPDAGRAVMRLLDRSLLAQTITTTIPRQFRLLHPVREFVAVRTDDRTLRTVRATHARSFCSLAADLATRVRRAARPELIHEAKRISADMVAAVLWTTDHAPELAAELACSLAVIAEHCGPEHDSLAAIGRAVLTPAVRAVATPSQLLPVGTLLCYGDLDLVADVATLALEKAADPASRLAAHHLAGYADSYRHDVDGALAHLDYAEALAADLDDMWQLGSIRQARGLALRAGDPEGALKAFASAMDAFARAGDVMHLNNVRYMMASTAADNDYRTDEARTWAADAIEAARASGNDHELAHATLAWAALGGTADPATAVDEALEVFRRVGDLRCVTRSYLVLADHVSTDERIERLVAALDAARAAKDRAHQVAALEKLIDASWRRGTDRDAARWYGVLAAVAGDDDAQRRCPREFAEQLDRWSLCIAEGRAAALSLGA